MRFHPTGRNAPHSRLHMLTCDVSVALSLLSLFISLHSRTLCAFL